MLMLSDVGLSEWEVDQMGLNQIAVYHSNK